MDDFIFFTGYFSTKNIISECVKKGIECVTIHPLSDKNVGAIDYSSVYRELTDEVTLKEKKEQEKRKQETPRYLSKTPKKFIELAQEITIGGISPRHTPNVGSGEVFGIILEGGLVVCCFDILAKNLLFSRELDVKKCKAIFLHNTEPILSNIGKQYNIPVFCINNGTVSNAHMKHNTKMTYDSNVFHYLHGEYDLQWLRERGMEQHINYSVTGNPAFDDYYCSPPERNPNVFLYSLTSVHNKFSYMSMKIVDGVPDPNDTEPRSLFLDMVDFPLLRFSLPSHIDHCFFKAFSLFQKKFPDVELWITLRPYSGRIPSEVAKSTSEQFGIKSVKVFDHEITPYRNLIQQSSFFVGGISTTIIEAVLNRTPTIMMVGGDTCSNEFGGKDCFIKTSLEEKAIFDSLVSIMDKGEQERLIEECNDTASYYNYMDDGNAAKRVVSDLLERI